MIPQNRRIVKWEIRRLPYKGGIGRAILPPVLPFMVCTQLPAHGHCFYVLRSAHRLDTSRHRLYGFRYRENRGLFTVRLRNAADFFTNTCGFVYNLPWRASRSFRRADSGVRRDLRAFVNIYKNEELFSTFRQFEQIAPRRSGKAAQDGRQGAEDLRILHWYIMLFDVASQQTSAVFGAGLRAPEPRWEGGKVPRRRTLLFSLLQNSPDCAILPQEKPKPKG